MLRKSKALIQISIIFVLSAMLLSGCMIDGDDALVSMMLVEPPYKLVYTIGQDTKLDLDGAIVRTHQAVIHPEGFYCEENLTYFDFGYIHSDADFGEEGVYTIFVAKKQWIFFWKTYMQYTIQVISPGKYENIVVPKPEKPFYGEEIGPVYCENVTAVMLSPPSNIIYPVGYTGEIDLSGIVVKAAKGWFAKKYSINDLDYTLTADVDFNTPGSYIVRVDYTDKKSNPYWFCFTVAVAEKAE